MDLLEDRRELISTSRPITLIGYDFCDRKEELLVLLMDKVMCPLRGDRCCKVNSHKSKNDLNLETGEIR